MTTNNTNAAARFLHMKGEDAVIGKALHSARNLLNLIEGRSAGAYAVRTLLGAEGFNKIEIDLMRAEVEAALNLPLPEAAPAAPAAPEAAPVVPAPAVLPDVETAVRAAVAKALDALIAEVDRYRRHAEMYRADAERYVGLLAEARDERDAAIERIKQTEEEATRLANSDLATTEQVIRSLRAENARLRDAMTLGMHYLKGSYAIPVKEKEVLAQMQAALDVKEKP